MEPEPARRVPGRRYADPRLALAVLAALGAGVAVTVLGAYRVQWTAWPTWLPGGLERCLATLAALVAGVALAASALRLHAAAAAILVAGVVVVGAGKAGPLLLVLLFASSAWLAGRRLRRAWRDAREAPLLDVLVGAGVLGTLASLLAHFPVLGDALCTLLIVSPLVLDHRVAREAARSLAARARSAALDPLALLAAAMGAFHALVALFPDAGWDAMAMHLFIPARVDTHAMWTFDATRYAWALMPTLVDFVYALVYVPGGGETAARLVNAGALGIAAALVARLARESGASPRGGSFAALLFLATPLTFAIGGSLYIEATWTALVLGGLRSLHDVQAEEDPAPRWITAAVLLGFAAAAKSVTLPMLGVFALVVAWQVAALRPHRAPRALALAGVGFALAAAKPYATAWLLAGNPVYPFYIDLFGGPPFDYWTRGPRHFDAPLSWRTPYDATFDAKRFIEGGPGTPGFQWLALLPAALVALAVARARRALALAAIGVALVVVVFAFTSYLRYVVPALAVLCATLGTAASVLARRWPAASRGYAAVATLVVAANLAVLNAASLHARFPVQALRDGALRDEARSEDAPAAVAGAAAALLAAHGRAIAYFSTPVFAASPALDALHPSWYSPAFERALRDVATPQALAGVLLDFDAPLVVVEPAFKGNERWMPLLLAATRPVVEWPRASVREVRSDFVYADELVSDAGLASGDGWTLVGDARRDAAQGALVVSAQSPAYQPVPVRAHARYLNSVRARCDVGRFRLQVNWLDADRKLVGVAVREFDCSGQWSERAQTIVAPEGAAIAVVYASGAGPQSVVFDQVSLRGRRR